MPILTIVETTTASAILERIKDKAVAKWGDKWIAALVREYVAVAAASGDDKATTINRRPQIERVFREQSCTLSTAIMLAAAVGCKFQMSCTEIKVINF